MTTLPGNHRHRPCVPQRMCSLCQERYDVVDLTHTRDRWVCLECFQGNGPAHAAAELPSLQQLDRTLRTLAILGRFVLYLVMLGLSGTQRWFADALTGALIADVVTWVIAAAWDLRFHRRAIATEAVGYATVLIVFFHQGGSFLTDDMEQRALAMLGFLAVFSIKISHFVWRLTHGRD